MQFLGQLTVLMPLQPSLRYQQTQLLQVLVQVLELMRELRYQWVLVPRKTVR